MSQPNKTLRLLIDGDLITFAAASACHEDFSWTGKAENTDDVWTSFTNLTDALEKAKGDTHRLVSGFIKALGSGEEFTCPLDFEVVFCLTGPNNFRKEILPTYKAHRGRKPPGYSAFLEKVEEWVTNETPYTFYRREGLEADDCLGILGTHQTKKFRNVIWSLDKDLRMVPCEHFVDGAIIPPEDGWEMRHPYQTLIGDAVDGYKGLPGCGPVAAKKILDGPFETVWERVEAAYVKKGFTRDDMIQQARVARILTADDYDFKKREPILWEPPAHD